MADDRAHSPVTVLTSNANNVSTVYAGNCTSVTDQAGNGRKSCSDALGRLTGVWEDPAGLNYETDYQYDVLGNLMRVDQKGGDANSANWRTRTFGYNSMAQLLTASNPESGPISYSYDPDGNVLTKTAPAPNQTGSATVTITYGYDPLNRMTGKTYSNGDPAVSYFYDQSSYNGLTVTNGIGRRTGMSDSSGATAWSYDAMGRALTERRTLSSITKSTGYTYNLDGSLADARSRQRANHHLHVQCRRPCALGSGYGQQHQLRYRGSVRAPRGPDQPEEWRGHRRFHGHRDYEQLRQAAAAGDSVRVRAQPDSLQPEL